MRKEKVYYLLIITCSLFLVPCYLLPAQTGVVRELSGTVELSTAGGAFVPAAVGAAVAQDTVISTGFRSSALIQVGSAMVAVRPLTRLSLTEIRAGAGSETVNMNLQAGRVRVDLNPPAGVRASMSVTTPSTTASVRGTSFELDTRNINVEYGAVSYRANRSRSYEFVVFGGNASGTWSEGIALDPLSFARYALDPPRPGGPGATPGGIGGNAAIGGGGPSPEPTPPTPPTPPRPPIGGGGGVPGGSDGGGANVDLDWVQ